MAFRLYQMDTEKLKDPALFAEYYKEMSEGRREKIDRAKQEEDRRLLLAAGILTDRGLQDYGRREATTKLRYGPCGKPYFADIKGLYFNLAHSHEKAIAVFGDTELGCDIQYMKKADVKLAERFFCPPEVEWMLRGKDEEDIRQRFYRLWVLKESFVKAEGEGLKLPLNAFCFEMGEPIRVEQKVSDRAYQFVEYDFGEYRAAVTIAGTLQTFV